MIKAAGSRAAPPSGPRSMCFEHDTFITTEETET
jgi:hypothetical protein